jgi:hypothetical protein
LQVSSRKAVKSGVDSLLRVSKDATHVSTNLNSKEAVRRVAMVTDPPSPAGGMKKAGIALLAAPDPFTGVGGAALLASAYAMRGRKPASLTDLEKETRKLMREIGSLSL